MGENAARPCVGLRDQRAGQELTGGGGSGGPGNLAPPPKGIWNSRRAYASRHQINGARQWLVLAGTCPTSRGWQIGLLHNANAPQPNHFILTQSSHLDDPALFD